MHGFGSNDITLFGRSLRNVIAISCISDTEGNNLRNSYDKTKRILLRSSNSFSFAYLLFPPNCITGDMFFQLFNDKILSTIKQKMKFEST